MQVQKAKTAVKASLQEIVVFDPAPDTLYKKVGGLTHWALEDLNEILDK